MKIFVGFLILVHVSQHASAVKTVYEGDKFVLLPCHVSTPVGSLVEWKRNDPNMTVHVRRDNRDQPNDQNEAYRSRTTLSQDALQTGDLSLTLISISRIDHATFTCIFSKDGVTQVQAVSLHVITKQESELRAERDVFIVLFALLLTAVCVGFAVWIIKRWKNSKDRTAANL